MARGSPRDSSMSFCRSCRPATGTVIISERNLHLERPSDAAPYLSGTSKQTVTPVALLIFVDPETTNWPVIFAGLAISVAPVLLAYFFLQKNVIKGFASGLKG